MKVQSGKERRTRLTKKENRQLKKNEITTNNLASDKGAEKKIWACYSLAEFQAAKQVPKKKRNKVKLEPM